MCTFTLRIGRIIPIAQELKLSQVTVRRAIRDLEREGLLETAQRYRPNGGKSSLLYSLTAEQSRDA